jgi:hypothetical protein
MGKMLLFLFSGEVTEDGTLFSYKLFQMPATSSATPTAAPCQDQLTGHAMLVRAFSGVYCTDHRFYSRM